MTNMLERCRAMVARAPSRRGRDREPYGWDRISAGAGLLDAFDPGWWREDAALPVDLATLNMADPYACVLGQRFAREAAVCPRPYEAGLLVLGVLPGDAVGDGFTGADADLLTPGWRRLISARRAEGGSPREPSAGREPAVGFGFAALRTMVTGSRVTGPYR